jgi:uridine nucleosidase
LFRNPTLARKTTLIPLDVTHQALATREVLQLLQHGSLDVEPRAGVSTVRTLFHEILTFFAATYSSQFGMYAGPPLHDPLAVFAVFAPQMFEDQGGERFAVHVVCGADDCAWAAAGEEPKSRAGECGRTVVALLGKDEPGVRIPREVDVAAFWTCLNMALTSAEEAKRV